MKLSGQNIHQNSKGYQQNFILYMNDSPLVSVIMPAYNAEKYIRRAIECILNQTHKNIELLIADDASKDKTRSIIESYNDDRIHKFHNISNIGYLKTCNMLLIKARGKFITFQDADDFSDNKRIEAQLQEFEIDPNLGVCGTDFLMIDDNNIVVSKTDFPVGHEEVKENLTRGQFTIMPNSFLFKKEILSAVGGYNIFFDRMGAEDYYWTWLIMEKYTLKNIKQYLYKYQFNPTSVTGNLSNNPDKLHSQKIVDMLITQRITTGTDMLEQGRQNELRAILDEMNKPFIEDNSYIYYYVAKRRFYEGKKSLAIKTILKAIRCKPFKLSYYKDLLYFLRTDT